jgi:hypothetical protein
MNVHRNEQGSALLLVLIAVVVIPILFGGLYLTLQHSHRLTAEQELQVQAEYQAQKMMEIALYYYYRQPEQFQSVFSGGSCLHDPKNAENSVCLEQSNGQATLVARGTADSGTQGSDRLFRDHIIRVALDSLDTPSDGQAFAGDICRFGDAPDHAYLLRALMLGEPFYAGNAMPGEEPGVTIEGGVYLGDRSAFQISEHASVRVSGYISAAGLVWSGNSRRDELSYDLLGPDAVKNDCPSLGIPYRQYLGDLYKQVEESLQPVDVYRFRGAPVTLDSKGEKKGKGYSIWQPSDESLGDLFKNRKDEPKIVLIEGHLMLPSIAQTSGWLIVWNPDGNATVYLPDQADWVHDGALIAERIRGYDIRHPARFQESSRWPESYRLQIILSREQADLYRQKR